MRMEVNDRSKESEYLAHNSKNYHSHKSLELGIVVKRVVLVFVALFLLCCCCSPAVQQDCYPLVHSFAVNACYRYNVPHPQHVHLIPVSFKVTPGSARSPLKCWNSPCICAIFLMNLVVLYICTTPFIAASTVGDFQSLSASMVPNLMFLEIVASMGSQLANMMSAQ